MFFCWTANMTSCVWSCRARSRFSTLSREDGFLLRSLNTCVREYIPPWVCVLSSRLGLRHLQTLVKQKAATTIQRSLDMVGRQRSMILLATVYWIVKVRFSCQDMDIIYSSCIWKFSKKRFTTTWRITHTHTHTHISNFYYLNSVEFFCTILFNINWLSSFISIQENIINIKRCSNQRLLVSNMYKINRRDVLKRSTIAWRILNDNNYFETHRRSAFKSIDNNLIVHVEIV